jgi:hypothetical protein
MGVTYLLYFICNLVFIFLIAIYLIFYLFFNWLYFQFYPKSLGFILFLYQIWFYFFDIFKSFNQLNFISISFFIIWF